MNGKNATKIGGVGIWGFFLFWVEIFLAVRVVLHFFAVNPSNGFAGWVFNSTNAMVVPFRGVFPATVTGHPHYVDFQTLFIMAAYVVFTACMVWLVTWFHGAVTGKK